MTVHPRNAISRRGGSVTSFEAEETITQNGTRDSQAARVLSLVRRCPGNTSAELAAESSSVQNTYEPWSWSMDRYVIARRLPEIEFLGRVKRGPARVCHITGHRALTWYPTSPGEQGRLFEETP
jgi:hypothetical protein